MNYRRGLFRLWIIITVPWVISLLTLAALQIVTYCRAEAERKEIVFSKAENIKDTISATGAKPHNQKDVGFFIDDDLWREDARYLVAKPMNQWSDQQLIDYLSAGYLKTKEYAEAEAKRFVCLALLVPLSVISIGSAIIWAILGFQAKSKAAEVR